MSFIGQLEVMKLLIVLLLCVTFIAFATGKRTKEERQHFKRWVRQFKKKYCNLAEETEAMEKMLINKLAIEEHNKLFEQGKSSYKRALWQHSDLSKEEKRKKLTGHRDAPDRITREADKYPTFPTGPAAVNWTERGLVGPVKDQGGKRM